MAKPAMEHNGGLIAQPGGAVDATIRVYYHDTDAGGVVYHATTLAFFERGRAEWLRHHGHSVANLANHHQLAFAVRRASVDYHAPARLDDSLTVRTVPASHTRSAITFAQTLLRGGTLLAQANILLVCVNTATFRPTPIPSFLKDCLNQPPPPA